jgi:hypothetical protein
VRAGNVGKEAREMCIWKALDFSLPCPFVFIFANVGRCLDEGAKEFIMKPVQMADVERLKAHVNPSSPSSSSTSSSSSGCMDMDHQLQQASGILSCNKRKFESEGGFEPTTDASERRPPPPPPRLLSSVLAA